MIALAPILTTLPNVQLRKNRFFYLWYDGICLASFVVLLALMTAWRHQPLIAEWHAAHFLLLPLAGYALILCNVFIHVCSHKSLSPWVNRVVGELCGVAVLTRFASWEVVHQRHHRYSDDTEKDPHPIDANFWRFTRRAIVNVEQQLQRNYFELFGDTPGNWRYEQRRAVLSYLTNLVLLVTWYRFLGAYAFVFLFVPASLVAVLQLMHANWVTHNALAGSDFHPINLNQGWYRVANRFLFGMYMHGNHHQRPHLLNPATLSLQGRIS